MGVEKVKPHKGKDLLVFCSNHKSHADYLLLGYVLYKNDLQPVRYIAGMNLDVPVLGSYFKKMGAVFVKRGGSHDSIRKYRDTLEDLCNNKEDLLIFPEGGRSYDGGIRQLKSGSLNTILGMQKELKKKDINIYFVPIGITYDFVPEEGIFPTLSFLSKHNLRFFNLFFDMASFVNYIHQGKENKKGNVYIRFGTPLFAGDFSDRTCLLETLRNEIVKQTVVLPHQLVSYAILHNDYILKPCLQLVVAPLAEKLRAKADATEIIKDADAVTKKGLSVLKRKGVIDISGNYVVTKKKNRLLYHANALPF